MNKIHKSTYWYEIGQINCINEIPSSVKQEIKKYIELMVDLSHEFSARFSIKNLNNQLDKHHRPIRCIRIKNRSHTYTPSTRKEEAEAGYKPAKNSGARPLIFRRL